MKKLWGGIFKKDLDALAKQFSESLYFDKKLAEYDVCGSIAHVNALYKAKVLTQADKTKLVKGLKDILASLKNGKFEFNYECEDIHTNIEMELGRKIGKVAEKLHAARSRNDQVVLDVKMYSKDAITDTINNIKSLQKSLVSVSEKYIDVVIPGYTHLRKAQPVLFSHYLMAFCNMVERDKERLQDAFKRVDVMPMGSCALSGTSFALDTEYIAQQLGFSKVASNSMDVVSDRDFIIEMLSALSIISMHLSRIAEDLILYSSEEFAFIKIDEQFCTGSSIMPHKINPDTLELIRGATGEVVGSLVSVLVLTKGLPLTYNRDLQNDKKPLFAAFEIVNTALALFAKVIADIEVNKAQADALLADESLIATDVAEYLTAKGCPFRQSHSVVGLLFRFLREENASLIDLSIAQLKQFSKYFDKDVYKLADVKKSVTLKKTLCSTNPSKVKASIGKWKKQLVAPKKKA